MAWQAWIVTALFFIVAPACVIGLIWVIVDIYGKPR